LKKFKIFHKKRWFFGNFHIFRKFSDFRTFLGKNPKNIKKLRNIFWFRKFFHESSVF
jgi:hypothetical protein